MEAKEITRRLVTCANIAVGGFCGILFPLASFWHCHSWQSSDHTDFYSAYHKNEVLMT